MVYVTQALRRKWADEAHEKRHPERVTERIAFRDASSKAIAEMRVKFPVLTADNFDEANAFRESRVRELIGQA